MSGTRHALPFAPIFAAFRPGWRTAALLAPLFWSAWPPAGASRAAGGSAVSRELRERGHDPAARWTAAGELCMVFVRDEPTGGRLYFAGPGTRPGDPVAVSPPSPAVVARSQTPPSLETLGGGVFVAVYSASTPDSGGSEIRAQRSSDGGATWGVPVRVNDDEASGPHGWISTAVDSSGRMQLAWLDPRAGEQGVVWTRTGDGIRFERNRVVDPRVCFCCRTKILAGANGRLWIAYRDLEGNDLRNVAVVAGDTRGDPRFRSPVVVSDDQWRIDGCPDSGPSLALESSGGLWAAWFNGAAPGIFAAFSADGGRSFSPRIPVAPLESNSVPNHPELAVLADGRIAALYVSRSAIFGRTLKPDRASWSGAMRLLEGAADPRVSSFHGRNALAYTAHDGHELVAVAETRSLDLLAGGVR